MKQIRVNFIRQLFWGILLLLSYDSARSTDSSFRASWFPWEPYQYLQESEGVKRLTGLDVQLLKAYIKETDREVLYTQEKWSQQLLNLKDGKLDVAAGVTWTAERAKYGYFSIPYRQEINALYVFKHTSIPAFKDIPQLLSTLKSLKFRLGVIRGYVYADAHLNSYINDPANAPFILKTENDGESLKLLLTHKIDGFLADRIVASTLIWHNHRNGEIKEIYLNASTPVHLMLSKKTISPAMLKQVNDAIIKVRETGVFSKIIKEYLLPVILMQTVDQSWFLLVDIIGTIAFAISGLLVAYRIRAGFVGTLFFAALPAVGGGVMRDIMVDRKPIGILTTPTYILAVLVTVLIGYLSLKALSGSKLKETLEKNYRNGIWATHLLQFFDAIGLACFTVIGTVVSLTARCEPLWLWAPILAFVTSAGGGILRDFLSASKSISALQGEIYGEVALFWGFIMALFLIWQQENIQPDKMLYAVISVMIGAFVSRLIAYFYKLRSPLFH